MRLVTALSRPAQLVAGFRHVPEAQTAPPPIFAQSASFVHRSKQLFWVTGSEHEGGLAHVAPLAKPAQSLGPAQALVQVPHRHSSEPPQSAALPQVPSQFELLPD
jgi:hypothetical protein